MLDGASFIDIDPTRVLDHFARILFAFLLALPLGWERRHGKASAGLRTFPVVAMAACGYGLIARSLPGADAESLTRMIQGLAAGVGFVGGGAILKARGHVRGLVTAASIWNTGAIGAAVALQRSEIAIVLSFVNAVALFALTPLMETPRRDDSDPP